MKYLLLITFVLMTSGCTFLKSRMFDDNNAKENLLISVINAPMKLDSIVRNSKFFDKNLTKFLNEKHEVDEVINRIKTFNTNGYQIKINTKYNLSKDNQTIDEFELIHEIGVVFNENYRSISSQFVLNESNWVLIGIGPTSTMAIPLE